MDKQVTFWINEKDKKEFAKKYKTSMSKFYRNCTIKAIKDEKFFKDLFFYSSNNKV